VDFTIYKALNGLAFHNDWLEDPFRFFANQAQFMFIAVMAALFFARGTWRSVHGRRGVAAAGFSALLALGIGHMIGDLWDRARPYEAHPGAAHLFVAASHDPSFPSDHATAAFALAVAIFLYHRRAGWLMLAMAAIVSLSRVMVGIHYPSDVLAGALLGSLSAGVIYLVEPVNRRVEALADWAAGLYEQASGWALRQLPTSS
jgi:undecaprenyl-diphosphatase